MKIRRPGRIPRKKCPLFSQNFSKVCYVPVFELSAIRARKVGAGAKFWCPWKDMQLYQLEDTKMEAFSQVRSPE